MKTNTETTTPIKTPALTEFASLNLVEPLMQAVRESGYTTPTPIQAQAIPALLEGHDLLGLAQTGTGKTAAFVLPLLQRMMALRKQSLPKSTRTLILTPTRELAVQINDSIRTYGRHLPLRSTVIFGGVGQAPQVNTMRRGVDLVVATPGRLLDLVNQGHVSLSAVEFFVLDEADRMLDMGFIRDIRKIIGMLPVRRQTLLFSATMPNDVASLAQSLLTKPKRVEVVPQSTTAERIDQVVYMVPKNNKRRLLAELLNAPDVTRSIVFTRTKRGADKVAEQLERDGIRSAAIHGNKGQSARQIALGSFRDGKVKVLVATDIAARGIDVDGISHVVNYDLPLEPESYVHRIGRTARAGATGIAISLCDGEERSLLRDIEKVVRMKLPVIDDHPLAQAGSDGGGEQITLDRAQRIREDRERRTPRPAQHGGRNGKAVGGKAAGGRPGRGSKAADGRSRDTADRNSRIDGNSGTRNFRSRDFRESEPGQGESRFEAQLAQAQRRDQQRPERAPSSGEAKLEPVRQGAVRQDGEQRRIDYRGRAEKGDRPSNAGRSGQQHRAGDANRGQRTDRARRSQNG